MDRISDGIKRVRGIKGITQEELADLAGINRTTIAKYETGRTKPSAQNVARMAEALGVSVDAIVSGGDYVEAVHVSPGAVRVPVLGVIPAGIPIEAIEDIIDWEEIPQEWARGGREFFGLKISGDSMSPRYESGDVVIFRRTDVCENGQDCAVMVNSDDATFKRVKYGPKGMMLVPLNPEYETRVFSPDEVQQLPVRVVGVAVQIRRDI